MRDRDIRTPAPNTLTGEMPPPKKPSAWRRFGKPALVAVAWITGVGGAIGVGSAIKADFEQRGAQQRLERQQRIDEDTKANLERLGLTGEIPLLDFTIATTEIEGREPIQEFLFSWQQNEGPNKYISDLPLSRIMFNTEETVENPTISFAFDDYDIAVGNLAYLDNVNWVMDQARSATVTISPQAFDGLLQQAS